MSNNKFEDNEDKYGKTQNLDYISDNINKTINPNKDNEIEKKLGAKNEYLNSIKSEKIPENSTVDFNNKNTINNNDFINTKDGNSNDFDNTKILDSKNFSDIKLLNNIQQTDTIKKKDGKYKLFLMITVFVSITAFLSIFVYSIWITNSYKSIPEPEVLSTMTTVVVKDIKNNNFLLYDIEYNKTYNILIDSRTEVINNNIDIEYTIDDISKGDVLNIYLEDTIVKKIVYPDDFFILGDNEQGFISGFNVSDDESEIYSENKKYNLSKNIDVKYNKDTITPKNILNIDKLYMKGYKDTIYYIDIIEFHGYINIQNVEKVRNPKIKIDDNKSIKVEKNGLIPITDGTHTVTITGDNINDYKFEMFIVGNENFNIDLSDIQNKKCVLIIKCNIDDYRLYINDKEIQDIYSPHVLHKGQYKIKVEKDGYEIWEETVNIEKSSNEIKIELQKLPEPKIKFVITTYPPDADIYINDELIGKSPIRAELEKGTYNFVAKIYGYPDIVKIINIDENTKSIDYSFQ